MEENQGQSSPKTQRRSGVWGVLLLLLLLYVGGGAYYYLDNAAKAKQKRAQTAEIQSLKREKERLAAEVDRLAGELNAKIAESSADKDEIKRLKEQLITKEIILSNLGGAKNAETLKKQISELERIKKVLQSRLDSVTADSQKLSLLVDSLKRENEILVALNRNLRMAVPAQSDSMQRAERQRIVSSASPDTLAKKVQKKSLVGSSKLNAFKIEVVKKKDRLTVKARRAVEIKVSFEVISDLEGQRPIYLVVADAKGEPIKDPSAKKAKIFVEGEPKEITYHSMIKIDFGKGTTKTGFGYKPSEKLLQGNYKLLIYTDDALLGYAEFRLER